MKWTSVVHFIMKFFLVILLFVVCVFFAQNVKRGFICGDPSLSLERKPDTVKNLVLLVWALSPIAILMTCELFFNLEKSGNFRDCLKKSWSNTAFLSQRYFVNLILMHLIIEAIKFFTGAHRPHFFETCLPDKMFNCTLGTFVSNYVCTNENESSLNISDASLSFVSGHAASCVFACLFICWYIQKRSKSDSLFLIPFAQTSLICLAYFGSISRVFDHRHHWWDVLAGAVIGMMTTYHTSYVLCNNQLEKPHVSKSESLQLPTNRNITLNEVVNL